MRDINYNNLTSGENLNRQTLAKKIVNIQQPKALKTYPLRYKKNKAIGVIWSFQVLQAVKKQLIK